MKTKLDEYVGYNIFVVASLLKRQIFRILSKQNINITPDQWIVLSYIWEKDGQTISELVKNSNKDFANVTRIINKLVKLGYVIKEHSKEDGRSVIVYATKEARILEERLNDCWMKSVSISMKGLSKEEQDYLLLLLDRIKVNSLEFLEKDEINE